MYASRVPERVAYMRVFRPPYPLVSTLYARCVCVVLALDALFVCVSCVLHARHLAYTPRRNEGPERAH